MKHFFIILHKFIDIGITILMFICCIFVILWVVSPIRDYLIAIKIFTTESYIGFVTSISILSVGLLWLLNQKISTLDKTIENAVERTLNGKDIIIKNGTQDIYSIFDKIILLSETKNNNNLDIIGSTLYTAWPHIHPWLLKETTVNWKINLFLLDPLYIEQNSTLIDNSWKNTSENIIKQIKNVKDIYQNDFFQRNVIINLFTYSYFPTIRGFKINDNILLTFSHWSRDGLTDYPHYFYECFKSKDNSIRAECYKDLYNNTLEFLVKYSTKVV